MKNVEVRRENEEHVRFFSACSSRLLSLSTADAAGADVSPFDPPILHDADLLEIRPPHAFRFIVRVAHMIPHHRSLSANRTDSRHGSTLSHKIDGTTQFRSKQNKKL